VGERDVFIGGGAQIINEFLAAGLLDELDLHLSPILLGGGERLFAGVGPDVKLEQVRVIEGAGVTHVKYRVRH
jgi:dihydrofolate reductase